jgi:uncharacterized protein
VILAAIPLVPGDAAGPLFVLGRSLSYWGGISAETGRITDPRHPQHGESVAGSFLVMPSGRGSCSSASVLLEAVRRNTAPVAILLGRPDPVLVAGAAAARELYGRYPAVAVYPRLSDLDGARFATVTRDGGVALT